VCSAASGALETRAAALEGAGIEFIPKNGGGVGLRLRSLKHTHAFAHKNEMLEATQVEFARPGPAGGIAIVGRPVQYGMLDSAIRGAGGSGSGGRGGPVLKPRLRCGRRSRSKGEKYEARID
jgi:hypothetical protein